jgi:hypothetical protein
MFVIIIIIILYLTIVYFLGKTVNGIRRKRKDLKWNYFNDANAVYKNVDIDDFADFADFNDDNSF